MHRKGRLLESPPAEGSRAHRTTPHSREFEASVANAARGQGRGTINVIARTDARTPLPDA